MYLLHFRWYYYLGYFVLRQILYPRYIAELQAWYFSNDYSSYFISDRDTVACCGDRWSCNFFLFHIIVCYWLDWGRAWVRAGVFQGSYAWIIRKLPMDYLSITYELPVSYPSIPFSSDFWCVIFTMGKANRNKSWSPSPFLLQKNTGNLKRQLMTSNEVMGLALF